MTKNQNLIRYYEELFSGELRELMPMITQELAKGKPVTVSQLATRAKMTAKHMQAFLDKMPSEWDDQKRLVGFGLTLNETPYGYEVNGHKMWTACAGDSLLFPMIIGKPGRLTSPCFVTNEPIAIDLTPETLESITPNSAVISIVSPHVDDFTKVRGLICDHQHFFKNAAVTEGWHKEHPGAVIMPVAEAYKLYQEVAMRIWPSSEKRKI